MRYWQRLMTDRFDTSYIDRALSTWESVKTYHHLHELMEWGNLILEQAEVEARLKKQREENL